MFAPQSVSHPGPQSGPQSAKAAEPDADARRAQPGFAKTPPGAGPEDDPQAAAPAGPSAERQPGQKPGQKPDHDQTSTATRDSGEKIDDTATRDAVNPDAVLAPAVFAPFGGSGFSGASGPLPASLRTASFAPGGLRRMPARPSQSVTGGATGDVAGGATGASAATSALRAVPENRPGGGAVFPPLAPAAAPGPGKAAPQTPAVPAVTTGKPLAAAARVHSRHRGVLASFIAFVLVPTMAVASYLWIVAVDQYASTVGFSVRTERVSSALDILGGITRLSGGSSSDSDILYDYIHSQELVSDLDSQLDLRAVYARAWPDDPYFAFDPDGTIEDLVEHWKQKVRIVYDDSSSLMTLRVLAFTPEEATLIATKILEHSTDKINTLAAEAQDDAMRYARTEMERALDRLKIAREAMTGFRMRTQMVDPIADLQGQMGILNSLQAQLAQSYVELDLLRASTSAADPRIVQGEQRIAVIRNRMAEERLKFSESDKGPGGEDYASMVAEFERLSVDREFAEQTYRVSLAAYDAAQAEAVRKSRYLAAHILPTEAQKSQYPQRWTLMGLSGFFLLMAWAIGVLIFYSVRDRR